MKKKARTLQTIANSIARAHGCGSADSFSVKPVSEPKVKHIRYGYCKYTTGEYVSSAYRQNYGWKNTYYQRAITRVVVPLHVAQQASDWQAIAMQLGEGC
jgi:hypothetical protein